MWILLTNGSFLNLAYAAKITHAKDCYSITDAHGVELGRCASERVDGLTDTVIPAAPNAEAIVVTWGFNAPHQMSTERRGVIAWRVNDDGAFPVLAGDVPASNQTVLILQPSGWLDEPFFGSYESLDQALKVIRERVEMGD